jgi:hypothetical protein
LAQTASSSAGLVSQIGGGATSSVFPGRDVKFDSSFEPRQVWSFTVEADEDFANDENFAAEEQRGPVWDDEGERQ